MVAPLATSRFEALRHVLGAFPGVTLPVLLGPAWQGPARRQRKPFSTTMQPRSKLGRTPIAIPPGVEITVGEMLMTATKTSYLTTLKRTVTVKGPLGMLALDVPEFVRVSQDAEERRAMVNVEDATVKRQREMWGTTWAYLRNYVTGVSEGHTAILRLVGIGYRASVEQRTGKEEYPGQRFLCLKLGFTHTVEEGAPRSVSVKTPTPTRVLLEGTDREAIMSFAGRVRKWRPPEPYKGKGIFINDQTIKLKQKVK